MQRTVVNRATQIIQVRIIPKTVCHCLHMTYRKPLELLRLE